ncbi:MAG: beta-glucosidase [Candidatus Moranbacteria bacterium CG23_combo_of_CG06-09_8_20_14_all_35_22]|nr:MAG: beta-glucosidase [Candidatus Moranbacteria bacterium CG23_combo_of_CG06-09_8_20_14_all_35_22]
MEEKKEKQILKFPAGFLWGTATSSHQVEGNCKNNWTAWEKENAQRLASEAKDKWQDWQQEKFPEMFDSQNYISDQACDHYNKFEEDFDLAKEIGNNAHRFSIEWSRIEPEEGKFDEKEVEHYRKVILALRERGMEPFVTLWHWTEPVWFCENGGWTNKKSVAYFERFSKKIAESLKNNVKFWIVANEPNVGLGFGYFLGFQPPGKKGPINFLKAYFNLLKAYKKAYLAIHEIDGKAQVGFAHSFVPYESDIFWPIGKLVIFVGEYFSKYFVRKNEGYFDFIGCNYYLRHSISLKKKTFLKENISDLGWEIYPKGIYDTLIRLKKYNLPVYITENGIADCSDEKRGKFIKDHLQFIHQAISEGVDVRGYFYWSLMDNFEFPDVRGFWPRFGLIEIDFETLERKPRKSFYEYGKICKNNILEI